MAIQNNAQLIGNVGEDPRVARLENGKIVARFSLATNERFTGPDGKEHTQTNWHNIVARGKVADIVENHVNKGKQVGVSGRIISRSFTSDDGNVRYGTEIEVSEILFV